MISLTPRLKAVADMVETDSVTDVGTDHGKLPIYLALSGKITKAIASDLNRGPLHACLSNVNKYNLGNIIDIRLSNGLDNFDPNETKTLCIAGMGGELMSDIISKHMDIACLFDEIILQPMTQIEHIKSFLYDNKFTLLDETLSIEGEKIYDIFKIKYSGAKITYTPRELIISDILIQKKDLLLYKYTDKLIKRYEKILSGLRQSEMNNDTESKAYESLICEVRKINEIAKDYQ